MARAGRYYGDRALYTCDTGHQIVGAEERVCQDTGQWSDSEPYCKKRGQYRFRLFLPGILDTRHL